MNHQQHPKQQNRPSLYEPRETTSAFSILGAAQPLGWSKQKSVGLAIISFIMGGILSGGAVGLIQSNDEPNAKISELATAHIVPKSIQQPTVTPPISTSVVHPSLEIKANHSAPESKPISTGAEVKNPLASFKDDVVEKATTPKQHIQVNSHANEIAAKNETELQRLIQIKTQHGHITAKISDANVKQEKIKLSTVTTIKNQKINHEKHVAVNTVVKQKKPLAHDKDVLLVKSMLDTMDHPLSVNITTRPKAPEGDGNH